MSLTRRAVSTGSPVGSAPDVDSSGAQVGRVLAVTAVDGSGKPTAYGYSDPSALPGVSALVPSMLLPTARPPRGTQTLLTTFGSGHGWVSGSGSAGTVNLNDTSDFVLGSQCISVTTSGGGNVGGQRTLIEKTGIASFDMTAKSLRIWFKLVAVTNLNRLNLNVGQDSSNFYSIDIGFPAGDARNLHTPGNWTVVDVDLQTLASTVGAPSPTACTYLRFGITDVGGGGTATVRLGGVALVDKPTTLYPNGVITIGFDDGYVDQYTTARPVLDKYGFPATCYVIQDLIPATASGTYMGLDQLKSLQDLSGWEIAAHAATVANHNITGGFSALTDTQLRAEFEPHKRWLLKNGFTSGANHFAYPQGFWSEASVAVAREYFTTARTIQGAFFSGPRLADWQRTHCYPINAGTASGTLTALVDAVKANKSWLQVYTHRVLGTGASGTQIDTATFTTFIDYIATQGVAVRTVGQVVAGI
jgi:peptidoglycan/xylan/chitin deacetylase (PgdA/CDA1 family)